MTRESLLGLPLEEALRRLRALPVAPRVVVSRAPRRTGEEGTLRVVRVGEAFAELTVCAFVTALSGETPCETE